MKALMKPQEAAEEAGVSVDTIKRSIRQEPGCQWPKLKAKRTPGGHLKIPATWLNEWIEALDDA